MNRIILFLFISFLIIGCSTAYRNITTQMPDLMQITDGVYHGNYNVSGTPVRAAVKVNVLNHRITNI